MENAIELAVGVSVTRPAKPYPCIVIVSLLETAKRDNFVGYR